MRENKNEMMLVNFNNYEPKQILMIENLYNSSRQNKKVYPLICLKIERNKEMQIKEKKLIEDKRLLRF